MKGPSGRALLVAATLAIVVSIASGIAIIGSPGTGRAERLDATRVRDLQGLMNATDFYWARNGRLPQTLSELDRDPRSAVSTTDPVTGSPYEYRILDDDSYELCATFDRPSDGALLGPDSPFWRHGSGRQCFPLDVDPTVGPPVR